MAASPDPFLTVSDHWVPCSLGHITKVPGSVSSERCKQKRETDSVYLGAGTLCRAEGGERGGIVGPRGQHLALKGVRIFHWQRWGLRRRRSRGHE